MICDPPFTSPEDFVRLLGLPFKPPILTFGMATGGLGIHSTGEFSSFCSKKKTEQKDLQKPALGVITPYIPKYVRAFIGVITPFITRKSTLLVGINRHILS